MFGRITLSFLTTVALAGCWAKFPDSRMNRDGPLPGRGDLSRSREAGVSDLLKCTPGAFIQCVAKDRLQRCNSDGDGTETVSCAPFACNPTAARCNECDPQAPSTCAGKDLVTCTTDGLEQQTRCAHGCNNGQCCKDVDKDGVADCDGDCNDNDPEVFPGQTEWKTTASNASFDYNCDGNEEQQRPDLVNCTFKAGGCIGAGWVASVPKCGGPGQLATCKKQIPNSCVVGTTAPATQACR